MPLRTRVLIICGVVFVFLAVLTLLIVRNIQRRGPKENTPTTTVSNLNSTSSFKVIDANNFNNANLNGTNTNSQIPVKKFTPAEATQNTVKQFAKIFIERYGSYSTDNNGQNVVEVKEMVTEDLWNKIKPKTLGKTNTGFVGMSTEVVSAEMTKWADSEATVKLKTIRTQEKNKVTSNLQQSATVNFTKQGTNWLVNSFVWE